MSQSPPKIRCTREDFEHVIEMFRRSAEEELENAPGAKLDIDKIVTEFRNFLEQSIETVASFEDDQRAQELKAEIENLQKKALRLKSSLQSKRTMFIDQVQTQAEQMLEQRRPVIPEDPEDRVELPPEFEERLALLDETIGKLRGQITEARSVMTRNLEKYSGFERSAQEFIKPV